MTVPVASQATQHTRPVEIAALLTIQRRRRRCHQLLWSNAVRIETVQNIAMVRDILGARTPVPLTKRGRTVL